MIIDEVHYDNGNTFPDENGKSMMLVDSNLDNNLGENWAVATTEYGLGDFGTPNETNFPNDCTEPMGDLNGDGEYNVLDVVALVNCVLAANCESNCSSDLNSDGEYNVLDVVALVNCVLASDCSN